MWGRGIFLFPTCAQREVKFSGIKTIVFGCRIVQGQSSG